VGGIAEGCGEKFSGKQCRSFLKAFEFNFDKVQINALKLAVDCFKFNFE
jgi:hypothetical protein